MNFECRKSRLDGEVLIPGSKSHTIRGLVIAAFADGTSTLHQPLNSADTLSAENAVKAFGANITKKEQTWLVEGNGGRIDVSQEKVDLGNSGTALRILMGVASLLPEGRTIIFDGDEQLRKRPAAPLLKALNDLGANVCSINSNDCPPYRIQGSLQGGKTSLEAVSSQYLTSLLIACPLAPNSTSIDVPLLYESQYVDMTLEWLDFAGIELKHQGKQNFHIPGGQAYHPFEKQIPADFSSASFFFAAGALNGNSVTCRGLDMEDPQADKAVLSYLEKMGASVKFDDDEITVSGGNLKGVELDLNETPDALPIMAVVACFAEGKTSLRNVAQARIKETDRIACMAAELRKLGATVEEHEDGLTIFGSNLKPTVVDGHSDHRIVMALAVAGLNISGKTVIQHAEAADVTFPEFAALMQSIGAEINDVENNELQS